MVYIEDLDQIVEGGCQAPDCDHQHPHGVLAFRSACHPQRKGVSITYRHGSGVLRVACAECDKVVMMVKVDRHPQATTHTAFREAVKSAALASDVTYLMISTVVSEAASACVDGARLSKDGAVEVLKKVIEMFETGNYDAELDNPGEERP